MTYAKIHKNENWIWPPDLLSPSIPKPDTWPPHKHQFLFALKTLCGLQNIFLKIRNLCLYIDNNSKKKNKKKKKKGDSPLKKKKVVIFLIEIKYGR